VFQHGDASDHAVHVESDQHVDRFAGVGRNGRHIVGFEQQPDLFVSTIDSRCRRLPGRVRHPIRFREETLHGGTRWRGSQHQKQHERHHARPQPGHHQHPHDYPCLVGFLGREIRCKVGDVFIRESRGLRGHLGFLDIPRTVALE
jgi:hypothetical protein